MNNEINSFSKKVLADALTRIREYRNMTLKEASQLLGVPTSRLTNYEQGKYIPSLPEIECLAYCYDVPISVLFSTLELEKFVKEPDTDKLAELRQVRHRIIATRLSIAMDNANRTEKDISVETGISKSKLQKYFQGNMEIPLDELVHICHALKLEVEILFDLDSVIGKWQKDLSMQLIFSSVPNEIKSYVLDNRNWPFIDTAEKIKSLPKSEIKSFSDSLTTILNLDDKSD